METWRYVAIYFDIMRVGLSLSETVLESPPVLKEIMTILASTSTTVVLLSKDDGEHSLTYNKLRLICPTSLHPSSEAEHSIKIWSEQDSFTHFLLQQHQFNLIIDSSCWKVFPSLPKDNINSILVTSIQEIGELLALPKVQLQKRCKMETILRSTRAVSAKQHSREKLRQIAIDYARYRQEKELGVFYRFMVWNSKVYLRVLGRAWTIWLIAHHEEQIGRANEQIVREGYFTRDTRKEKLRVCFEAWKRFFESKVQRRR